MKNLSTPQKTKKKLETTNSLSHQDKEKDTIAKTIMMNNDLYECLEKAKESGKYPKHVTMNKFVVMLLRESLRKTDIFHNVRKFIYGIHEHNKLDFSFDNDPLLKCLSVVEYKKERISRSMQTSLTLHLPLDVHKSILQLCKHKPSYGLTKIIPELLLYVLNADQYSHKANDVIDNFCEKYFNIPLQDLVVKLSELFNNVFPNIKIENPSMPEVYRYYLRQCVQSFFKPIEDARQ